MSIEDYPSSLELRKVYEQVSPEPLDPKEWIRVVDESGEDYLYPRGLFLPVTLPRPVQKALAGHHA